MLSGQEKDGVVVSVVFTGRKSTFIFKSTKYLIRRFIFSLELRMQKSNRMQEIVSSFFLCVYFVCTWSVFFQNKKNQIRTMHKYFKNLYLVITVSAIATRRQ